MNLELGLRVLGSVMEWDDDRARDEFRRLRLMASLKYDGYRDFEAGVRFIESLASWLQQFRPGERAVAYDFVIARLVYIGPSEMEKLVAQLYTNFVRPELMASVALQLDIPRYSVLMNAAAHAEIDKLRRRTLFLGLSDGARVDYIRHHNVGLISNEQVVGTTQLDTEKWRDLLKELQRDTDDGESRFRAAYLIDDFAATGTSFFRVDRETGEIKGKLVKFASSVRSAEQALERKIFDDDYRLFIHHYVGTSKAKLELDQRLQESADLLAAKGLARVPETSYGMTLPESLPLDDSNPADEAFLKLVDEYYDDSIHTRHTRVGGTADMKLGYGGCALPLVLDHNTPNNSLPLLWAETTGRPAEGEQAAVPAMRPLFRRRQRHA